jgi:hypothetical protein
MPTRTSTGAALLIPCKHGFPATLSLRLPTRFHRPVEPGVGEENRGILSWNALRDIATEGIEVAPHSHTHPQLDRLPSDRLVRPAHPPRAPGGRSARLVFTKVTCSDDRGRAHQYELADTTVTLDITGGPRKGQAATRRQVSWPRQCTSRPGPAGAHAHLPGSPGRRLDPLTAPRRTQAIATTLCQQLNKAEPRAPSSSSATRSNPGPALHGLSLHLPEVGEQAGSLLAVSRKARF